MTRLSSNLPSVEYVVDTLSGMHNRTMFAVSEVNGQWDKHGTVDKVRIDSIEEVYAASPRMFIVRTDKYLLAAHPGWICGDNLEAYRLRCLWDLTFLTGLARTELGYDKIYCTCGKHE